MCRRALPHAARFALAWGYFERRNQRLCRGTQMERYPQCLSRSWKPRTPSQKTVPISWPTVKGLFLLVQPNGSKLWRMKYRFGWQGEAPVLGYPEVGLSAARELRLKAKHAIAMGEDPMGEMARPTAKEGKTFERIAKLWHEKPHGQFEPGARGSATRVWSRLERDVLPFLGEMHIEEITAPDVLAMIRQIEARAALEISRRAKQCVGQVFQFAIASGSAKADPTTHLRGFEAKASRAAYDPLACCGPAAFSCEARSIH